MKTTTTTVNTDIDMIPLIMDLDNQFITNKTLNDYSTDFSNDYNNIVNENIDFNRPSNSSSTSSTTDLLYHQQQHRQQHLHHGHNIDDEQTIKTMDNGTFLSNKNDLQNQTYPTNMMVIIGANTLHPQTLPVIHDDNKRKFSSFVFHFMVHMIIYR